MTAITTPQIMAVINSSYAVAGSQNCAVQAAVSVPLIVVEEEEQQEIANNAIFELIETTSEAPAPFYMIPLAPTRECIHISSPFTIISTTVSTTQYWFAESSFTNPSTTETDKDIIYRTPGTISNFYAKVSNGTTVTTINLRKNAAAAGPTLSISASASGHFIDTVNTCTVAAGDKLGVETITGTASSNIYHVSFHLDSTSETSSRFVVTGIVTVTVQEFLPLEGGGTTGLTEANANIRQQVAGTFKNLAIKLSTNSATSASTCVLRKNTADSAVTISIASAGTGVFEDTANTVSVAAGDDLCFSATRGTSGQFALRYIAVDYGTTTTNTGQLICSSATPMTLSTTATKYHIIGGTFATPDPTESSIRYRPGQLYTFSLMTTRVSANTRDGASTITFRKNAADGNQTVSIGAAATGVFSDSTHTDVITAVTDEVDYKIVTAGTTGSITVCFISVWTDMPVPSAGAQNIVRTIAETAIAVSEALVRLVAKTRTKTETITISESPVRLAAKTRTLSETVGPISDSVVRIRGIVRAISETITISESLARLAAKIRTRTETIVVSESAVRLAAKSRPLSQTVGPISESIVRVKGKVKTLSETVGPISESITRLVSKVRTLSQTVTISESLSRLAAKSRPLSQTVTISESVARVKGIVRTLAQTVSISESLARMTAKIRTLSQTVTVSESLARVKGAIRTISQTVSISDAVSRTVTIFGGGNAVTRALSQTIVVSENLARLANKIRSRTETVAISENLLKSRGRVKAVPTQTVTISDSIAKRLQKNRIIIQAISILEQLDAYVNGVKLVWKAPAGKGGAATVPYRKKYQAPRIKQILYPVYSPAEMQRIERRRKLRRFEPLVVIPAFRYNINQTVAPFIITNALSNTVNVKFAVRPNNNNNNIIFTGKAIPIKITPSEQRIKINKAKCESFIMSEQGLHKSIQTTQKRMAKITKLMKLWFMAKELLG